MLSSCVVLLLLCTLSLLIAPATAFGAGDIPVGAGLDEFVWRHGDIATAVLLNLPGSFQTNYAFTELEKMTVYFGNWLRDYSQIVDVTMLGELDEPFLRAIVSVLAFMQFGLATDEFDVTQERLGCYRHVEHIDNPKGYASDAKTSDNRLRGRVEDVELEIDPKTGMKNYIANSGQGWDTSADYIRDQLLQSIDKGRKGSKKDALIHLGSALHTLEDFGAHSNFVELCLVELGEADVFPLVGDSCRINTPHTGKKVAPIVTGTFGMLDVFHSLLGEAHDKAAVMHKGTEPGQLDTLLKDLNAGGKSFDTIYEIITGSIKWLSKISTNAESVQANLEKVHQTAKRVENDPAAFKPDKNNLSTGPNALWEAVEPAFALHDSITKWLIQNKNVCYIDSVKKAVDEIKEIINLFVYRFLALIIEPSVREMQSAAKKARVTLQKAEGEQAGIFAAETGDSNPSHTVLSKDHFQNVLNPPAGLVATVTTNWTTQEVVRCWDDANKDANSTVDELLKALHHPAFVTEPTFLQKAMQQVVQDWWTRNPEDEKRKLRSQLSKAGVQNDDNNNENINAACFHGKEKGPAVFDGSQPVLVPRPPVAFADAISQLVLDVANRVEQTANSLAKTAVDGAFRIVGDSFGPKIESISDDKIFDMLRAEGTSDEDIKKLLRDLGFGDARLANLSATLTKD